MRFDTRRLAVCAAAAAALAASSAFAEKVGNYHIFATPEYQARMGHAAPPAGSVNYYGGSVFPNVKVVSVIWGSDVNPTTVSTIPGFSQALVQSTYVDQLKEYSTHLKGINGHKGTKQTIGRGTFLGQFQIKPKNTSLALTDADVQAELKYQINKGKLPARDLDTLYMVYFPDNVTITLDGLVSCRDFGAYHFASNDTKLAANNLFYTVEPSCHYPIQNITFAASHEFDEGTTDNVPTPGSNPDFPQAWNDANGFEIADLCGGSGQLTAGSKSYTVTQVYLNSLGHCSTGNYTSP